MLLKKLFIVILTCFITPHFIYSSDKATGRIGFKLNNKYIVNYNKLAKKLCDAGQTRQALLIYNQCINKAIILKRPDLLSYYYNEIGNIEADFGNNTNALKNYHNSLKFNTNNSVALKAKVYKIIGALYLSWKKFDQALQYYNTAYKFALKANENKTIADCFNNMGTVYEQQNKFKQAELVYDKALGFYKKLNAYNNICITYNNLAILNKSTKRYNAATRYYKLAIYYASKAKNDWVVAAINNNVGNLLFEMGNVETAKIYLNKALLLAKKINANELVFEALENLSKCAAKNGNFKLAYLYFKKSASAKSTFINIENTKEIIELQTKFDVLNKEKKITLLYKENTIQKLTNGKRNAQLGSFGLVFVLVCRFCFIAATKLNNKTYCNKPLLNCKIYPQKQLLKPKKTNVAELLPIYTMALANCSLLLN